MEVKNLKFSENTPISNNKKNNEDVCERSKYFQKFTKYDIKNLKKYVKQKFKNSSTTKNNRNILKPLKNTTLHRRQLSMNDNNSQIRNNLYINLPKLEEKEEFDINKLKAGISNLKKYYIRKNADYFYELINKLSIIIYLKNINSVAYNNLGDRYKNGSNNFNNDKIKKQEKNYIKNVYKHKIINNNKYVLVNIVKKSSLQKYQMSNSVINFSILRKYNNINEKLLKLIKTIKIVFIKNSQIKNKLKNNFNDINKILSKSYSILPKPKKIFNVLSKSSSSLSSNKTAKSEKTKPKKILKITYRNVILDKNGLITKIIEKNERRVILSDKRNSAINFVKKINKIFVIKNKYKFLNYLKSNKIMDNTYQYVDPIDFETEPVDEKIEEFRIKLILCFLKPRNTDIDD